MVRDFRAADGAVGFQAFAQVGHDLVLEGAAARAPALGADELKGAKEKLGISLEPFSVPDDVLKAWREAGGRGAAARKEWEARFAELGPRKRAEFERRLRHERPASLAKASLDERLKSPLCCNRGRTADVPATFDNSIFCFPI